MPATLSRALVASPRDSHPGRWVSFLSSVFLGFQEE